MPIGIVRFLVMVVLVASVILVMGCRDELSDNEIDRIITAIAESEELHQKQVEAFMENPSYQEYLADTSWIEPLAQAQLALVDPSDECATVILMALVIAENYAPPTAGEAEALCEWYVDELEEGQQR